jgi:hypothetical protein
MSPEIQSRTHSRSPLGAKPHKAIRGGIAQDCSRLRVVLNRGTHKIPHSGSIFGVLRSVFWLVSLILLAPEVGLEPTTLRLTATELVAFPLATDCYKSLFVMDLADLQIFHIATRTPCFSIDFDRAWVQKWVQRLCSLAGLALPHLTGPICVSSTIRPDVATNDLSSRSAGLTVARATHVWDSDASVLCELAGKGAPRIRPDPWWFGRRDDLGRADG